MVKEKPTSFLWLFLFLFSSPLLYGMVWYYYHHFSPSNSPLPQEWADFVQVPLLWLILALILVWLLILTLILILLARKQMDFVQASLLQSSQCPVSSTRERKQGGFVQVPLLQYFNNKGIGSVPGQADFDGSGFSYPEDQLPPTGHMTTLEGIPYQFPGRAPDGSDNIAALGQTITLPQGNYQQAFLLVANSWIYSIKATIVVHYMDGSTTSASPTVYDWNVGPSGVVNTDYRFSPSGKSGPVHIYAIQISMDSAKIASSLTLPMTAEPSPHTPCLHVFALTLQD
jgi:alpha-L-fucosidase